MTGGEDSTGFLPERLHSHFYRRKALAEINVDPHQPGAKLDQNKAPIFRGLIDYFPRALTAIAQVSNFGANKYMWRGWETVDNGIFRYSDAMIRHVAAECSGEIVDPESGLLHAAHAAWGALARLELMLREKEKNGK